MAPNSNFPALAVDIFSAIKAASPGTVFLCDGAKDTVLVFNGTGTRQFRYQVSLCSSGDLVEFSDSDHVPLTIFLEERKDNTVRMVIIAARKLENFSGTLEYDSSDSTKNDLVGHILLEACQEGGEGRVAIHAIFTADGKASLIMDSSPKLRRHLELATNTWRKMWKGGDGFVDVLKPTGDPSLEF